MAIVINRFQVQIDIRWATAKSGDLSSADEEGSISDLNSLSTGTFNYQGNNVFSDTRTIVANGNDDLDLAGTALQNIYGDNLAFSAVKRVYVQNVSDNEGTSIIVADTVTNSAVAWAVSIDQGDRFLTEKSRTGYTVTAGTGDLLRIKNSDTANAATYNIVIAGVSS